MMTFSSTDSTFAGSIPMVYEQYLVPLIFDSYAEDMTRRVMAQGPTRILEVAAGTGVVTRRIAMEMPDSVSIMATDLNPAMLDMAASAGTARPVKWRPADAMELPFPDESFDMMVCQFGVMFFPDKAKAFAEARRVLRPGGMFLFNVWDSLEENDFARIVNGSMMTVFPDDPPRFLARTPYNYHDCAAITQALMMGGFMNPCEMETVTFRSVADSPRDPVIGYCQGCPLRMEIEARDPSRMDHAMDVATEAIARQFGSGRVDGKVQAHVVAVMK